MKRILFFLSVLFAVVLWQSCEKEVLPGSIYGVVTDKATGEPIKSAGVELNPGGLKTVTGSEGQFEFVDLTPGKYNLIITKTGYVDFASSTIEVKEGQTAKSDVQIEKLPPSLRVVDDNNEYIHHLPKEVLLSDFFRNDFWNRRQQDLKERAKRIALCSKYWSGDYYRFQGVKDLKKVNLCRGN